LTAEDSKRRDDSVSGEVHAAADLAAYQQGGIVSRVIFKNEGGSVTVFAFDRGQSLSEHTVPFDAVALILEGEAEIVVGGTRRKVPAGSLIRLPADVPHAVAAPVRFKMVLSMSRSRS